MYKKIRFDVVVATNGYVVEIDDHPFDREKEGATIFLNADDASSFIQKNIDEVRSHYKKNDPARSSDSPIF